MTMRYEKGTRIGEPGAVYEFNVKLSMRVRGVQVSDAEMWYETEQQVSDMGMALRDDYPWIGKVYLTGRSNGWLAVEDKTGGATEEQLETIEERIDEARVEFEKCLVSDYGHEKGYEQNAVSPKLRKAYDFFKEHAGYVVGRRGMGALELARAEQYADDHGWEAIWEDDPEPYDMGDMPESARPHEVLTCVLRDENGVVLGSLGSIGMSGNARQDRDYGRVVEAELALEAMPEGLTPNRAPRLSYVDELKQKPLSRLRHMQSVTEQQIARAARQGNTRALEELQVRERELQEAVMQKEFGGDSDERKGSLRPNGTEPRKYVIGSGPWWTYYETGSLAAGDKAIHIHRVPTQKLARINALSLQRSHGGFVTVVHKGREVDSVGPEQASWIPGRAR